MGPVFLVFMQPIEYGWEDQWALVDCDNETVFNGTYRFNFADCVGLPPAARRRRRMKVLVACEESQEVCKAFRALGHRAYSCDEPCSGGHRGGISNAMRWNC